MGFACNGTWQESDPDACLQVPAGGAGTYMGHFPQGEENEQNVSFFSFF